jgi:ABC-type multidrug transport system ATPase subunit
MISKGKSVVVGTPDALREKIAGTPKVEITLKKVNSGIIEAVKKVNQVKEVTADEVAAVLTVTLGDAQSGTPEMVKKIVESGGLVLGVNILRPSLEEAYLKLIKEERK